jgi:tripartite-type tricarboxylate transporter receptor subunit TctC
VASERLGSTACLRFEAFLGFFGPRAMPDHIRDRISADIRATASSEDLAPKFKAMSMKVRVTTPSELEKIVGGERATLARITGPTQQ